MTEDYQAQGQVRRIVRIGNDVANILIPRQSDEPDPDFTYWWGLSSSAVALARHIAQAGTLAGETVLDIGCGVGLIGVSAALLGATVTFTDLMTDALQSARANCAENGIDPAKVDFIAGDWSSLHEIGTFGMVVGSEVVYDYFTHGDLVNMLCRVTRPDGRIILADRKRLAVSRFLGRLTDKGFRCSETLVRLSEPGFPEQDVSIFQLQRRR